MKLFGKVAIVTGGARGIGEATVRLFLKEGASVVIADISKIREEFNEYLNKFGDKAFFIKTDVSNEDDVINMINKTLSKYSQIDILFANAGISNFTPFLDLNSNDWQNTLNTNLNGVFYCNKYAIKQMKSQKNKRGYCKLWIYSQLCW